MMMNNHDKKISALMDRFFPEYLRRDYSKFIDFIRYFLEYLESRGQIHDLISDFLHYIDVDKLLDGDPYYAGDADVLQLHIKQYLSSFPLYRIDDIEIRKLIKNAKDFYNCKGTERSYEFIFRLMNHFGDFSFYYPSHDILTVSDYYGGRLDSDKMIHDNYYRAFWTYEIRSNLYGYAELKSIIENILHPTGCKVFFRREVDDYTYAYMPTAYEYGATHMVFVLQNLPVQWIEYRSVTKIYTNSSGYGIYDEFTFQDLELYYGGILSLLEIKDWGDTFHHMEYYGLYDDDFWPFQQGTALTVL